MLFALPILASLSAAQSLANILLAAAISTLLLAIGVVGRKVEIGEGERRRDQRRVRGLWIFAGIIGSLMTLFVARAETTYNYSRGSGEFLVVATIALVGLVSGVILVLFGLRGRWIGDHPYCRRCDFDLFGKPAESTICNECGANLARPRAISFGIHHRRLVPLLTGAFFITVSLALSVSVGSSIARGGFSLVPYQPTWLLVQQVSSSGNFGPVEQELGTRLIRGTISASTAERIVRRAEGNGVAGRASPFADMFTFDAWAAGRISEATARRALRRQLTFGTYVWPQTKPTRIRYMVYGPSWMRSSAPVEFAGSQVICEIDGQQMPPGSIRTSLSAPGANNAFGNTIVLPSPLPPGRHHLVVKAQAVATLPVAGRKTLVEEADVVVVDQHVIINEGEAEAGADDWDARGITANIQLTPLGNGATDVLMDCSTEFAMNIQANAFVRSRDGSERGLGPITITGGSGTLRTTLPAPDLDSTFEIVLKPTAPIGSLQRGAPVDPANTIVIEAPILRRLPRPPAAAGSATRPAMR